MIVSLTVITLLFALIYKVLPNSTIWRDVWVGALVTAGLFTIGRLVIGLYLGTASIASTYGAAGSVIVILVWVYYSSQIILLGAEFTRAYVDESAAVHRRKNMRRRRRKARQGLIVPSSPLSMRPSHQLFALRRRHRSGDGRGARWDQTRR